MRFERRILGPLLLVFALCSGLHATVVQEGESFETILVTVTAVSGSDVYLDQGRRSGLEPGDDVRLLPLGGSAVKATILSVSSSSARARLFTESEEVDIGTTGEVRIPSERLEEPPDDSPEDDPPDASSASDGGGDTAQPIEVPEHPPWAETTEPWDTEAPLLAPIAARKPEERDWRARGRLRNSADYTSDKGDTDVSFLSLRSSLSLDVENPFRRAGELELKAEYYHRTADLEEGNDSSDTRAVLSRLSYHVGGRRDKPTRFEVGRFLQNEFPEFGLLDGMDVSHRFDSGSRAGASIGFLPEPNDRLSSGDDFQLALYYRYVADPDERLALGLGYQKTWHHGEADRDLLVGNVQWTPTARARLFASAWVDHYTSSDDAKGSGLELTQLQVNGNYNWDTVGVGLFATEIRFPELLRDEFNDTTFADDLADEKIRRIGLSAWKKLSSRLRLDGRVNSWEDEEDSGGGGDLRITARDVFWKRGSVSAGVFTNSGNFTSGDGVRFSAVKTIDAGSFRLNYDITDYEQDNDLTNEGILQQAASLYYDTTLGRSWDLSLFTQILQQEDEDSLTLGITLQKRF